MCVFAPLGKIIYDFDEITLDPRPITNLIHRTGDWALIFIFAALAVRPLSRILRFNRLLDVRRMIGVGAFVYASMHFTLYTIDLMFNWREIASEIVHRARLTLGFVALLGLTTLTATSTNGMIRRMGSKRWQRLHQAIYLIGLLVGVDPLLFTIQAYRVTANICDWAVRLADRLPDAQLVEQDRWGASDVDVAGTQRRGCCAYVHLRGDGAWHPSEHLTTEGVGKCVRFRNNSAGFPGARRELHSRGA
jgi:DMSO/TMAO reductase YedYZ heme-binding membrane subunit